MLGEHGHRDASCIRPCRAVPLSSAAGGDLGRRRGRRRELEVCSHGGHAVGDTSTTGVGKSQ